MLKPTNLVASLCLMGLLGQANAMTITSTSVTITPADAVGSTFDVGFDGNVSLTQIPGLSAEATFTLESFTGSNVSFAMTIMNTSTFVSRVTSIGFDTDPELFGASVDTGGIFPNAHLLGQYPNGFGNIDVCFNDAKGCEGGGTGGVDQGASGLMTIHLTFSSDPSSLVLSNFGVRYQSIEGVAQGNSGTGVGTPGDPGGGGGVGQAVTPEPASYMLLGSGLLAVAFARRRKSR